MSYADVRNKLKAYGDLGLSADMASASPHKVIQMLMQGALEKIAIAKNQMQANDMSSAGANISWAISIIDGLRISLDKTQVSELPQRLDDLYEYMNKRLLTANLEKNPDALSEVSDLMRTIKSGWDGIAHTTEARGESNE